MGAGLGYYIFRQSSTYTDPSEDASASHVGLLVTGGVEFRVHKWISIGADGQYSHVPGIFGNGGLSLQAHEGDLGGIAGRVKVIVGR